VAFDLPKEAIEELAGGISARQFGLLTAYAELIIAAPRAMNLVSGASVARLSEHMVDSAAVLSVVDFEGRTVVDLGSGGGFPGVVVAVLRPRADVVLVDSRRSKATFLKSVQRKLQLPNLDVVQARLEDLRGERAFEVGLSRALGKVERTLASSLRLVADGGCLVLFKGPGWEDEADAAGEIAAREGALVERTVRIELPGLGRSTTFVVFHVKRNDR
jgi:16S rRNA (guanine527-N7)-methyltransferase